MTRAMIGCAMALVIVVGCGGTRDTTEEPATSAAGSGDQESESDEPLPGSEPATGTTLSPEECEARGGTLVGDIGDGAIHQPGYLCPNGQPPIATVPLGIEGSVCCGP